MTIDPALGAPLLEPLLRLQSSSHYGYPYAAADLGMFRHNYVVSIMFIHHGIMLNQDPTIRTSHSPTCRINRVLNVRAYIYPYIDKRKLISFSETGNMLIMSYAQARFSGDPSLIEKYVRILFVRDKWSKLIMHFSTVYFGAGLTTWSTTHFCYRLSYP